MTEPTPMPDEDALRVQFSRLRQGHVFSSVESVSWMEVFPDGTDSAVIVSQSCDVVLPKRESVLLAPVVTLTGEESRVAKRRDNPRYVHLPLTGEDKFADLGQVHAVLKGRLYDQPSEPGISLDSDNAVRMLALAVGRWFSRFAFPDEVHPWLSPLYSIVRQKYDRPASPIGKVLQDVVELRVEAEQWSARPLELTLHVIARAGAVPTLEDDDQPSLPPLAKRADGTLKAPGDLASLLLAATVPSQQAALWGALADSMAELCKPGAREQSDPLVAGAVSEITAVLWSDDEFPLSRFRKSELLDLDYLSTGFPL